MKKVMLDFIKTEMAFHAKSLELLTDAYTSVSSIDEQKDIEVTYSYTLSNLMNLHFGA